MEESKLKESLEKGINELILTVSYIKTFVKASESLLYDYDEFQISDIQNMYDELEKKVKELDETTEKINDIAHELNKYNLTATGQALPEQLPVFN